MPRPRRRQHGLGTYLAAAPVRLPVALLAFSLVCGTTGYVAIEGFGLLNALYMTVTTLTTVGSARSSRSDRRGGRSP